ncbi:MAG: TetR/AcrR family transcriptional regulator [Acidobacteriota bacterium]
MSPRKYQMQARAEAAAATRAKIVEAAKALHAARGVRATSWDEIAARARVATATVYRHFPTLADLVPACARSVFDIIRPPTLDEAAVKFAALATPGERLAALVGRSVSCYLLGADWLHAAYREREFVPELDRALRVIQDTLHVLVRAAAGRRLAKGEHAALFTLCDFPFFKSLVDTGLDPRAVERRITELVIAVEKEGRR